MGYANRMLSNADNTEQGPPGSSHKNTADSAVGVSQADVELIFGGTPFMLTLCGRDLCYRYVSRSYAEMLGRSPADFVDVPIVDILGKEAFETIRPRIETVLAGEALEFEDEVPLAGIGPRYLRVSYVPAKAADGSVSGWIASLTDITERKHDEESLRESALRYSNLFESIDEGFCVVEMLPDNKGKPVDFRYLETSPSFERQSGMKDVVGKTLRELSPAVDEYWIETFGKVYTGGEPVRIERREQSSGKWFSIYAFRVGGPEKRQVAMLFSDITARKEIETDLRTSEERRKLAQDAGNVGIWDWDIKANRTYWSETMWAFYGENPLELNPDEAFWSSHLHEDDAERVKNNLRDIALSDDDQFRDEFRIVHKDGSVRWIEAAAKVLRGPSGEALRMLGVNLDITERKNIEERLRIDLTEKRRHSEELQRAHDELELRVEQRTRELAESNAALLQEIEERSAGEDQRIYLLRRLVTIQESERSRIARDLHDQLGQRLTALRLKIASLKEISANDAVIGPRVERLQEIAERLDSEVSFLAWELRPSALDDLGLVEALGAFVAEWSRHYETQADFHAARVSRDRLNPETETHLYRMTQEALNNIAKHAGATQVTVLLENRENSVLLIIEDNGSGFETARDEISLESGKGLGLIGMRERASLVGGEIEIESSIGNGTTIYIRIPYTGQTE